MQANERLLGLWIEALCKELEELANAPITAATTPHHGSRTGAYETVLLAQGPVRGELFITVGSAVLVQFTQLAAGEPLDPEVTCDADRLEAWRRLLDGTGSKLSARLTADFTDESHGRCLILLADTHLAEENDPLAGEPGSRIERWLLQAGQSKLEILARARVELPEEKNAASSSSAEARSESAKVREEIRQQEQPVASTPISSSTMAGDQVRSASPEPQPAEVAGAAAGRQQRSFRRGLNDSFESSVQSHRLDLLLDIELEATLRFGAIEMPLHEVLELGPGDVLSLDRHVQEPVELVVGDRIVARGEVVLIGGNFGLHVTEVAEPRRRLETIRCLF